MKQFKKTYHLLTLALTLTLFLCAQHTKAQGYGVFEDIRQYFHVFDHGRFKQLETLKIQDYKVGRNLVAYVNNQGQFKVYQDGYDQVLKENTPERYEVTDYIMVFELGGQLHVFEKRRSRRLASFVGDYAFGDSIIAFMDVNRNLNVYYKKQIRNLEVFDVQGMQVGKNILAYTDNLEQFQVYYAGQKKQLEVLLPRSYKTGRNTLAYVDSYGRFKIYHKDMLIQADPFPPQSYQVGDDKVGFVNRNGQFMVFDDGLIMEIENQPPDRYEVNDAVIVYSMPDRSFKAYYDAEVFHLESYIPESYQVDNAVLVYPDYMNNLKALYYGKKVKAANRLIRDYELTLDVISSDVTMPRPQFFYKEKFY